MHMPFTSINKAVHSALALFCAILLGTILLSTMAAEARAQIKLPSLGDSMAGTISSQQEYEFGRELLRSMRRQTPMLDDPLIEEYISNLTFKLATHSELTDHRLSFLLIDSEALNAFAAPGGIIGVNAGLFEYSDNEGELASVLAHELAHLSQRHYARNVEMARNSTLPNLAALVGSLVVAATVGGDAGQAAIMGTQAAQLENQLSYSRSNESEADRVGIRTLYDAGFDPNDMATMFEEMLQSTSYSRRPPEFLSTHPLNENRVADSRNRARDYPQVDTVYNIEFLLMKQRVEVHYSRDYETHIAQLERALPQLNGQQEDAARYGIALAQLEAGRFADASESLAPLLNKEPRRITYNMLLADIARAAGSHDRALSVLEENLRINPGNHPLTMNYATTLEAAGRYQEAANVLERHAGSHPENTLLWYELAEVEGLAGNISEVHQARAEYYFSVGDFSRAQENFRLALDEEDDPVVRARIQQRQNYMRTIQGRYYR